MEQIVRVCSKGAIENVVVNGTNIPKVEVTMQWGENQIIAAAFDKQAATVAALQIDPNALYVADLSFSISKSEKKFQNVRLNRLTAF